MPDAPQVQVHAFRGVQVTLAPMRVHVIILVSNTAGTMPEMRGDDAFQQKVHECGLDEQAVIWNRPDDSSHLSQADKAHLRVHP